MIKVALTEFKQGKGNFHVDFMLFFFCRPKGHFQAGTGLEMGIKLSGDKPIVFNTRQKSSLVVQNKKNKGRHLWVNPTGMFLKFSGLTFSLCGNLVPRQALG